VAKTIVGGNGRRKLGKSADRRLIAPERKVEKLPEGHPGFIQGPCDKGKPVEDQRKKKPTGGTRVDQGRAVLRVERCRPGKKFESGAQREKAQV